MIRACAAFDLVVTALLAWPPLARGFVEALYAANGALGGAAAPPPFFAVQWFFVSLAGALGVLWAVVRLLHPLRVLAIADVVGRTWVAGLVVFSVRHGAPGVLLVVVATELGGALAQLRVLASRRRAPLSRAA